MKITINSNKEYDATPEQVAEIEKILCRKATYEDIEKIIYHSPMGEDLRDDFISRYLPINVPTSEHTLLFTSKKHLNKIQAINKLLNVAKYLNNGWVQKFDPKDLGFEIVLDTNTVIVMGCGSRYNYCSVYFETQEAAKQAIEILGEETIKTALSTDY